MRRNPGRAPTDDADIAFAVPGHARDETRAEKKPSPAPNSGWRRRGVLGLLVCCVLFVAAASSASLLGHLTGRLAGGTSKPVGDLFYTLTPRDLRSCHAVFATKSGGCFDPTMYM